MKITLNGQTKELLSPLNLKAVVEQCCRDRTPVVAELNGKIIQGPQWEQVTIKDGDCLELVSFVGGGKL